jgi:hypothetical protein
LKVVHQPPVYGLGSTALRHFIPSLAARENS